MHSELIKKLIINDQLGLPAISEKSKEDSDSKEIKIGGQEDIRPVVLFDELHARVGKLFRQSHREVLCDANKQLDLMHQPCFIPRRSLSYSARDI